MFKISGGNATFSRDSLKLKVRGDVTLYNDGAGPAQILRLAEEQHVLIDGEPVGSAGGGRGETVALAPGEALDLPFETSCGSPATRVSRPLRLSLHAGLRIEFTEDDGETLQDLTLYAGVTGLLAAETLGRPLAAIARPDGQQYDILFDAGEYDPY